MERRSMSLPSLVLEDINNEAYPDFRAKNLDILKSHFICPNCKTLMNANMKIFQCIDGHIVCENCKSKTEVCTCSLYQFFKKIFLRNVLNVVWICLGATTPWRGLPRFFWIPVTNSLLLLIRKINKIRLQLPIRSMRTK